MAGLRMLLDPAKTGPDALVLEENLRKRIIGQDHAIREMEISGVHLLLVINDKGHFQGIFEQIPHPIRVLDIYT